MLLIKLKRIFGISYDVTIIGGGHAGCEAAHAAAQLGVKTCLISQKKDTIGEMSCNPSMGGVGKGHLVREIEALGGLAGKISDAAAINLRMLNIQKGVSSQGLRTIVDRDIYKSTMLKTLTSMQGLTIQQNSVENLEISCGKITDIIMTNGTKISSKTVIIATGTFLRGKIHIGEVNYQAGRHRRDSDDVEPATTALAQTLFKMGFKTGRFKTGTPPRLKMNSIDFSQLEEQKSQNNLWFSYDNQFERKPHPNKLLSNYITHTNQLVHKIVTQNINLLPNYSSENNKWGKGPRYCPSLELKVQKFPNNNKHTIFLQRQGLNSNVIYPTGLSTGFPFEIQKQIIKNIKGLENAEIIRPAYAIQYDFIDPRQLENSLRSKIINNLYFAGQINGTTGYEQAGAQGIVAGINAARQSLEMQLITLSPKDSMIGVLIDDIVSLGVTEPYRMIPTRSNYKFTQRYDNADERLTPLGISLGLVKQSTQKIFQLKQQLKKQALQKLERFHDSSKNWQNRFKIKFKNPLNQTAKQIIQKTQISVAEMSKFIQIDPRVINSLNILIKFNFILKRENKNRQKYLNQNTQQLIDFHFLLNNKHNFPAQQFQKLLAAKPKDIHAASRIDGIRKSTVFRLLTLMKNRQIQMNRTKSSLL